MQIMGPLAPCGATPQDSEPEMAALVMPLVTVRFFVVMERPTESLLAKV